jgi:hypothetical protein
MRSISVSVISAATLMMLPQAIPAASPTTQAQYVYGTVKSIPADSAGSLDLTEQTDLKFQFGKSSYRLPYGRIKSFQFSETKAPARSIAHVPLPNLLRSRAKTLDVSFYDAGGSVGSLSFRLTGRNVSSAEWLLKERIRLEKESAQGRAKLPESWWGDRYWKTTRNKSVWPDPAEPAGTR